MKVCMYVCTTFRLRSFRPRCKKTYSKYDKISATIRHARFGHDRYSATIFAMIFRLCHNRYLFGHEVTRVFESWPNVAERGRNERSRNAVLRYVCRYVPMYHRNTPPRSHTEIVFFADCSISMDLKNC